MKIICIGRNYAEHASELRNPLPESPIIFLKPASSLAKTGKIINYPDFTNNLHYECEVVLKIRKKGKNIPLSKAKDYFAEWTLGLDLTARDLQQELKTKGLPWEIAKSFDQSAVIGAFLKIDKEHLYDTSFFLYKNKELAQQGNTKDLLFSFEKIIHYASRFFTLEKDDLIFTGTPKGVGALAANDKLVGILNDKELFKVKIK